MSEPLDAVVSEVARETFEQLAFVLPPQDDTAPLPEADARVCVTFRGPFSGSLLISLSSSLLPLLAANMLGMEESETSPGDRDDAFREVANVVCGNLLPRIAGPKPVFGISSPRCLPPSDGPRDALPGVTLATVALLLENGRAIVQLNVDDPAALEHARAAAVGVPA